MSFWASVLRCSDGSYYVGHTDHLDGRIGAHNSGLIDGYTQSRRPVTLIWSHDFPSREEAFAAGRRIKRSSRAEKEALSEVTGTEFSGFLASCSSAHPSIRHQWRLQDERL